jgi:hypothetical protein
LLSLAASQSQPLHARLRLTTLLTLRLTKLQSLIVQLPPIAVQKVAVQLKVAVLLKVAKQKAAAPLKVAKLLNKHQA